MFYSVVFPKQRFVYLTRPRSEAPCCTPFSALHWSCKRHQWHLLASHLVVSLSRVCVVQKNEFPNVFPWAIYIELAEIWESFCSELTFILFCCGHFKDFLKVIFSPMSIVIIYIMYNYYTNYTIKYYCFSK